MSTTSLVLSVSELTQAIKYKLEGEFPSILVQGEVSNFKKQASNHLYFTLKDQGAQIQCVMFSFDAKSLSKLPNIGDQVQVKGEINVYPPRGNYQIIVRALKPAGIGELLALLEERKKKYLNLGYFAKELKKPIPKSPKRIGVVTSPTGAVIRDILQILNRRLKGFHLLLNPVKVQGEGASHEIAKAIDQFNQYHLVDVLIVARGGGSMEDLWPFNEEVVIESIYKSHIPVVSAIGHETDTTLSDWVADLRAPTPSAAAELVSQDMKQIEEKWQSYQTRFLQSLRQNFIQKKRALAALENHPFLASPRRLLAFFEQRLDEMRYQFDQKIYSNLHRFSKKISEKHLSLRSQNPHLKVKQALSKLKSTQVDMDHSLKNRLEKKKQTLLRAHEKFDHLIENILQNKKARFESLKVHLQAINPKKVLDRGYSILFDEKKNSVILSTQDITLKQKVKVVLKDGFIKAEACEIKRDSK